MIVVGDPLLSHRVGQVFAALEPCLAVGKAIGTRLKLKP
jgi:hypothetical protein